MSIKIIKNNSISIDSPYRIFSGESHIPSPSQKNHEEAMILDAMAKESEIINNANLEASRIMDEAKNEASSFFNAKIQEGFDQGYRDGLLQAQREMEGKLDELDRLREDSRSQYQDLIKSAEPDIIKLVMEISRKFLKEKLENDKDVIIAMCRDTIQKFTDAGDLVVKVSSHDYGHVLENKTQIMARINSLASLEIVNDDNLEPGSCLVESKNNSVDSSVDKRLQNIQKTFEELLKAVVI